MDTHTRQRVRIGVTPMRKSGVLTAMDQDGRENFAEFVMDMAK
jgi:hypothetical protein